jgi:hypothetical protein
MDDVAILIDINAVDRQHRVPHFNIPWSNGVEQLLVTETKCLRQGIPGLGRLVTAKISARRAGKQVMVDSGGTDYLL